MTIQNSVFYVGGSKGGVGKSLFSFALVDYLLNREANVLLVDTDTDNPDVYKFVNYPITSEKFAAWEPYNQQYMQQLLMGNITIDETIAKWQEYWGY